MKLGDFGLARKLPPNQVRTTLSFHLQLTFIKFPFMFCCLQVEFIKIHPYLRSYTLSPSVYIYFLKKVWIYPSVWFCHEQSVANLMLRAGILETRQSRKASSKIHGIGIINTETIFSCIRCMGVWVRVSESNESMRML